MIFKLLKVLPWVALGYVLGAQAGRARYEQIAAAAQKVKNSAPVQSGVAKAAEKAPVVADAVKEKAATAAHAATDKLPGHGGGETGKHVAPEAGLNGTG
ncbi:MAG TPA: hypothetical protein VIR30_08415, partial [Nocardioides sp.]